MIIMLKKLVLLLRNRTVIVYLTQNLLFVAFYAAAVEYRNYELKWSRNLSKQNRFSFRN